MGVCNRDTANARILGRVCELCSLSLQARRRLLCSSLLCAGGCKRSASLTVTLSSKGMETRIGRDVGPPMKKLFWRHAIHTNSMRWGYSDRLSYLPTW